MKKTILLVPGFRCDTYSSIEDLYIETTKALNDDFNVIWLVPSIKSKYNRFKHRESVKKLKEPLYVSKLRENQIDFVVGNISKFNFIANFFLFLMVFKKSNIDATCCAFGFERFYAAFFGKLFAKKTIWYEQWYSLGGKFASIKRIFYYLFVDNFIAVSDFIASTLPVNKPICIMKNSIKVKNVGNYDKYQAKKLLGLNKYDHIVLMIAAFREVKRYDLAINIAANVKKSFDNKIGFVFLGGGELYEKYYEEIKKRKLDDIILMPGHVADIESFLKASDIKILTSEYEGFALCLLEAANYKLPVISFDTPASREFITDTVNGYLIPFADCNGFVKALTDLIENPKKMIEMGEMGHKKLLENFSMSNYQKLVKETFRNIMGVRFD